MDNADNDEAGQARLLAAGAPLQVTIDAPAVSLGRTADDPAVAPDADDIVDVDLGMFVDGRRRPAAIERHRPRAHEERGAGRIKAHRYHYRHALPRQGELGLV